MCTVSYLPIPGGCLISSNRDEAFERASALEPAVYSHFGQNVLYPKDPVGEGTWIATSDKAVVCLFNGAFVPHQRKASYRVSRGVVPISFFYFLNVETFINSFNFSGIEPFSLVVFHNHKLTELKWDETKLHRIEHDPKYPHIWASATLYSPEVFAQRKTWFSEWLEAEPAFTSENIMNFHCSRKDDRQNGLFIDRANGLKTASVTSVRFSEIESSSMTYHDLKSGKLTTLDLVAL
jgi:uncharacterized protein with NRDE domain